MEKIKINEIQLKGPAKTICVVNYNEGKEATLNTKWQEQEVDFLQKDVGIGGEVSVVIAQKGQYTNITEVDMTSAKPSQSPENREIDASNTQTAYTPKPTNDRECSIVAQVILKGAVELAKESIRGTMPSGELLGELLCECVNELTGAYKLALSNVKAL